ncbi:TRAP transporter substrate-binding protein [Pseudodonghicola flavimaris]|uniref:TRAP transporter substrate-binding protein DctP n=1 Tax=Pseudodonghicola flavimaris TaxID=3050036 RepID=A0ABT7F0Q7_9RHOB|nr:TRAP transporter substrate-binding protein DctP [Pseudodonghicola flavimaris]MDK3018187.1 TRAP transporter substrate-binding protein DctP [Pseudodonghicola flavimaris]
MTLRLPIAAALVALAGTPVFAQSVTLAEDTVPDLKNSGTALWSHTFIEALKADGWSTEVFPYNTIGGEDERLDQIRSGILDVSMSDYRVAVEFNPEMRVPQLPYQFQNEAHYTRFMEESGFLAGVNETLVPEGFQVLSSIPLGPFAGLFNNKHAVKTAADMSDLRMRALDTMQMDLFGALGASGVVVPWTEVPNAIQTGIADGYINPVGVPVTFGQADLFDYFTDFKAAPGVRISIASTTWLDGLSEAEKAQVAAAVKAADEAVKAWLPDVDERQKAEVAAAGIAVYEPTAAELATFAEAAAPIAEAVDGVAPERLKAILEDIKSYAE